MRLYICAGLSESSLQLPSGSRDVLFSMTLLLSVLAVKVLMRLNICAGLSESSLQLPSGSRDVSFCLALLLSMCEQ